MNEVILMGRLTADPKITQTQAGMKVARYTLAVDRRGKKEEGQQTADFPSIVVFGKGAEFAEGYLFKGTKIVLRGRIQTGSYTNKDGVKVYTTDVVADDQEFAESKKDGQVKAMEELAAAGRPENQKAKTKKQEEWMKVDPLDDEGLPFM